MNFCKRFSPIGRPMGGLQKTYTDSSNSKRCVRQRQRSKIAGCSNHPHPLLLSAGDSKILTIGTELTRVSHESALNPRQSVALCIFFFEVYISSIKCVLLSSICVFEDSPERYTRRCTLIEDTHFSLERYTGIWSYIMIKSNRCAILPECDTLV